MCNIFFQFKLSIFIDFTKKGRQETYKKKDVLFTVGKIREELYKILKKESRNKGCLVEESWFLLLLLGKREKGNHENIT